MKNLQTKKNDLNAKLDKLKDNIKKRENYTKENNDEKVDIEKELDNVNKEYNDSLNEYAQLNEHLEDNKYELNEIKYMLNKTGDNDNEKLKYIYKLKESQKIADYLNNKIIKQSNRKPNKIWVDQ